MTRQICEDGNDDHICAGLEMADLAQKRGDQTIMPSHDGGKLWHIRQIQKDLQRTAAGLEVDIVGVWGCDCHFFIVRKIPSDAGGIVGANTVILKAAVHRHVRKDGGKFGTVEATSTSTRKNVVKGRRKFDNVHGTVQKELAHNDSIGLVLVEIDEKRTYQLSNLRALVNDSCLQSIGQCLELEHDRPNLFVLREQNEGFQAAMFLLRRSILVNQSGR
mmetsp:Transcript_6103/g.17085  ORF Transcript_6103/g.17085 Transcript_6103/m.17085 type:complete len:218 (-) Transcript_6103:388-1041(-)